MTGDGPPRVALSVDPALRGEVRLAWIAAAPVRVAPAGTALRETMERTAGALRERHVGRSPSQIDGLRPARDLYKRFGVDPTKTRPSSEALLRRALKGLPLPAIHNAVDVGNLLSLEALLPLGLYDAAKIRGEVVARRGRPGEAYAGIRKADVHLDGRLMLADAEGPFGNPTSDSARTSVDAGTRGLWLVLFAPGDYPAEQLAGHVARGRELMARHLAGDVPVTTDGALIDPAEGQ